MTITESVSAGVDDHIEKKNSDSLENTLEADEVKKRDLDLVVESALEVDNEGDHIENTLENTAVAEGDKSTEEDEVVESPVVILKESTNNENEEKGLKPVRLAKEIVYATTVL